MIESSVIIKGMDRINRLLTTDKTHPTLDRLLLSEAEARARINRLTTTNGTEPLLETDEELADEMD